MKSKQYFHNLVLSFTCLFFVSCASTLRERKVQLSEKEIRRWFEQNCHAFLGKEVVGEWVVKSQTEQFKGQYPASIRIEKNPVERKSLVVLEITHLLGGTVARLQGNAETGFSLKVPSKPKLSKQGLKSYLGLNPDEFIQALKGGVPCPGQSIQNWKLKWNQSEAQIESQPWNWTFEFVENQGEIVPKKIQLYSGTQARSSSIQMTILEWDSSKKWIKKAELRSGNEWMRWTWRSREVRDH